MIEIRTILCPVDFSDVARHALDHAAALARWYEASLAVIYVHPMVTVTAFAPGTPLLPAAVLSDVDRAAMRQNVTAFVRESVGTEIPADVDVMEGAAAAEILDAARARDTDLIVMGTHGRSGFERLAMGSVAEKVLRQAAGPVLTVPPRTADVVPVPAALFKRVLCGIDFSTCTMRALDFATSIARETGGELTVVHVMELLPDGPAATDGASWIQAQTVADYLAASRADQRARLDAAVPPDVSTYCTVNTVMATGKPYREILRVAADRQSDLIVIGVHGSHPVERLLFGSTAQQLVRLASCPVLTIRT